MGLTFDVGFSTSPDQDKVYDVVVIGSGPAGLTAAHDLALEGHQVTIFHVLDGDELEVADATTRDSVDEDDANRVHYYAVFAVDEAGNRISGKAVLVESRDCFVQGSDRLVAAVGVDQHIIVETADAVFVCPRARAQDVKHLVTRLKQQQRPETERHRKVYRPWGTVDSIVSSDRFQVKRLIVRPEARISRQQHNHRAEHWIVVKGTALVQRGEEEFILREDASTYIPIGIPHRLANPGKIPLEIIEVRTGSYLEEDDIARFEDDYGR